MKKTLATLRTSIKKGFGERCKDFCYSCPVCSVYMALDILEDHLLIEFDKKPRKKKKI